MTVIDMDKDVETKPKDHPVLFEIGSPGARAVSLPKSDVPPADRPAQPSSSSCLTRRRSFGRTSVRNQAFFLNQALFRGLG